VKKLTFLVVDDERLSRDYIQDLIIEFAPGNTIHEASSVTMALQVIKDFNPDILFLDISMPDAEGFTLLQEIDNRDFELIFITAYSQYAINAIKAGACDYLVKPIRKIDFKNALEVAIKRRLNELERRHYSTGGDLYLANTLLINQHSGVHSIVLKDIVFLKADNTYTTFFCQNGHQLVASKPIKHFEDTLSSKWFFRIHKSHIINMLYFKEYSSVTRVVVLKTGHKFAVSRYRLSDLLKKLRQPAD